VIERGPQYTSVKGCQTYEECSSVLVISVCDRAWTVIHKCKRLLN